MMPPIRAKHISDIKIMLIILLFSLILTKLLCNSSSDPLSMMTDVEADQAGHPATLKT